MVLLAYSLHGYKKTHTKMIRSIHRNIVLHRRPTQIPESSYRQYRTVGFIGLGNMGFPMLKNLLSKLILTDNRLGTEVLVFDSNKETMSRAQQIGATQVNSLAQIAMAQPQFIITVLPSCESSLNVTSELIQHPALSSRNSNPCTIIDCSTIAISSSRLNHNLVQKTNNSHVYMDAPISGGVRGAQDGSLTFMLGTNATQDIIDQVRPILQYMGKTIHICGGSGAGIAAKLCNNLALATQMIGICEAMNLGVELGLDPLVLTHVINSSTASCWSSRINNPHPQVAATLGTGAAANNYIGGFASKLMLKDLGLVIKASEEGQVSMPLVSSKFIIQTNPFYLVERFRA